MVEESAAAQSVLKLSSLLRYMLETSQKSMVSLDDEVQFIESYLALERLRLSAECQIEMVKEDTFSMYEIPPFLLIPFVENAFKHGKLNGEGSFVQVHIAINNKELHFDIKNSIRKDTNSGHQLGLANVEKRLELLNKPYNLDVQRRDNNYHVHLKLKL